MEPRHRTRSNVIPDATATWKLTQWHGTESNPDAKVKDEEATSVVFCPGSDVEVMDDYVVPDFFKRRARGEIFNNPMHASLVTVVNGTHEFFYTHLHKVWRDDWSNPDWQWKGHTVAGSRPISYWLDNGELSLLPVPDPLDRVWLEGQAVTQAWANCELSKAAALATIAESKESVTSIFAILRRVLKIAIAAKKLQFGKLAQELKPKELADRWMEVRYALRPLVYDAKAICEALDAKLEHDRQTFRGFKKDNDVVSDTVTTGGIFNREWQRESVRSIEVRSGVLTQIESLHALNTWGFDSIIETAWELVPLSFVFDWFWNLGETLASWTPEVGLNALASWYVTKETTVQSVKIVRWYPYNCAAQGFDGECTSFTSSTTNAAYVKTVVTTDRVPDPSRAVLPKFRINLNAAKLLDLSIIGRKKLA